MDLQNRDDHVRRTSVCGKHNLIEVLPSAGNPNQYPCDMVEKPVFSSILRACICGGKTPTRLSFLNSDRPDPHGTGIIKSGLVTFVIVFAL